MKRINSLEGLRGIAALMVLFSHLGVMFYPAYYWGGAEEIGRHCEFIEYYLGQTPLSFLFAGHSAVMIFFVLTGFGSFMVCDKGREQCVKYASLRFFKLAVLLILSTIVIWALFRLGLVYYNDIVGYTCSPWIEGWGNSFDHNILKAFLGNWFTVAAAYNPVLWTMPYIFISSVICVVCYMLWGDLKRGYAVPVCVGTCFVIFGMKNYVACMIGYLLAYHYKHKPAKRINVLLGGFLLLLAVFLCGYPMEIQSSWILYRFLPKQYVVYYHMLGASLLIYVSLYCSPIQKIMESKPFFALGKYSMSIFVAHFAILVSLSSYLFNRLIDQYPYNTAAAIVWVVTVLATCIAAVLLKRVIDRIYGVLDRVYVRLTSD